MSDQSSTAYVNKYLENTTGMLHELLGQIITLRTQIAFTNEVMKEKDDKILALTEEKDEMFVNLKKEQEDLVASLKEQLDKSDSERQNFINDLNKDSSRIAELQAELDATRNKITHMDTLTSQLLEFKNQLKIKSDECVELKNSLNESYNVIAKKDDEIRTKDNELKQKNDEITDKNTEIATVNNDIDKLKIELEELKKVKPEPVKEVKPVVKTKTISTKKEDNGDDF